MPVCDGCERGLSDGELFFYYTRKQYMVDGGHNDVTEHEWLIYRYCLPCDERLVRLPTRASLNSR